MKDIQKIFDKCLKITKEQNIPISKNINPTIRISNRYKKTLATCTKAKDEYILTVSSHILDSANKVLEEIILHELIHTINGCFNHGAKFKKYCNILNEKYGYEILTKMDMKKVTYSNITFYKCKCPHCGTEFTFFKLPSSSKKYCYCGYKLHIICKNE